LKFWNAPPEHAGCPIATAAFGAGRPMRLSPAHLGTLLKLDPLTESAPGFCATVMTGQIGCPDPPHGHPTSNVLAIAAVVTTRILMMTCPFPMHHCAQ
jgi:hypothetical protein